MQPNPDMNDINNLRSPPAPCRTARIGGVFGAGVESGIEIVPHPRDAAPSALLANIPASVSHKARIAGRWCGAAGWSAVRSRTGGGVATNSLRFPGPSARPRRGGVAPGLCRARPRGVSAVLWLGQRRALPRCAAPAPSLSEPCGRLCPFGELVQLRRGDGDPAAYHRAQSAVAGNNVSWAELAQESALVLALAAWR